MHLQGRRAKKRKVIKAKRPVVATKFKCPFCNHATSVECKISMAEKIGKLLCRVCEASYSMTINYLTEPVDVFYEWLDDCEKAREQHEQEVKLYGVGQSNKRARLEQQPQGGGEKESTTATATTTTTTAAAAAAAAKETMQERTERAAVTAPSSERQQSSEKQQSKEKQQRQQPAGLFDSDSDSDDSQ